MVVLQFTLRFLLCFFLDLFRYGYTVVCNLELAPKTEHDMTTAQLGKIVFFFFFYNFVAGLIRSLYHQVLFFCTYPIPSDRQDPD